MKTKKELLTQHLIDYVIGIENEDFFDNIEDYTLTPYEMRLLNDWEAGNIDTTEEIKQAMLKISEESIYAAAICLFYKWV